MPVSQQGIMGRSQKAKHEFGELETQILVKAPANFYFMGILNDDDY